MTTNPQILMGLGGTVDYELVWDANLLSALALEWSVSLTELPSATPIRDERGLLLAILSFIHANAGGERYVESPEVLNAFSDRFLYTVTLGGTCVRAATVLSQLGIPSTVHLVSIDENVRRLLPSTVSYICSANEDSLDPHVIVQYPAGASIRLADGEITSSRPNRIILAHDVANEELVLDERLVSLAGSADVFAIAGFNVMKDEEKLRDRLAFLVEAARAAHEGLVIFEEADYHAPEFQPIVVKHLVPNVDVYSMNEEEFLGSLNQHICLCDADAVVAAARALRHETNAKNLLVHTSAWALVVGPDAQKLRDALRRAIDVSSARFMHGDALTTKVVSAIAQEPKVAEVVEFADSVRALGADVAVEVGYDLHPESPTTIGLGDSFLGGFIEGYVRAG